MSLLKIQEPGQELPLNPELSDRESEIAVGIDLGTTNSLIAISKNNQVEILVDDQGNKIHPSVLSVVNGRLVCGLRATQSKGDKIYSVKRLMGKNIDDVRSSTNLANFLFKKNSSEIKIILDSYELSPVEVSAEILKFLKINAENNLKKPIIKSVITVPAYFDEKARNQTKEAAVLAGLEVLRLISEPTAAAIAYGLDKNPQGLFAVFDLGGGTFDISILRLQKGVFKVIGVGGDANFGGDDFDDLIFGKIIEKFSLKDLSLNQIRELKLVARKIKENLTDKSISKINFDILDRCFEFEFSLKEFEQIIASKVENLVKITTNLLDDLELGLDGLDGVILVGGSTRIPLIRKKLGTIFGSNKILTDLNPDEVVAMGAAIQAEALSLGSSNLLLDVTPLSLGIETMGGIVEKIIERNSAIPISVTKEFTTYADNQTGMKIHVVQGERELVKDCISLADFEIKNIPPMKAGAAVVQISFTIDADGLLIVKAQDKTTSQVQAVEIKPRYGLDDKQIKDILLESMRNAKSDIEERLLVESKVEAKGNILLIESLLKESPDLLDLKEIEAIKAQIDLLKSVLDSSNRNQIEIEAKKLEKIAVNLAEEKMNLEISGALKGKKIEEI